MSTSTIHDLIAKRCEIDGESDAVRALGRNSLSYRQLLELVDSTQVELNAHGVGRNDRVAIVLASGAEMGTCCLAVSASATCAPLNPDYTDTEFERLFASLRPTLLITSPGIGDSALEAAKRCNIAVADLAADPDREAGRFDLSWVSADVTSPATQPGSAIASDTALVLHTSGSTSLPKVVPLTHANLCASARNVARSLELGADDRCLNMMPMYHVGALVDLLLSPLSVGGSVVTTRSLSSSEFFECLTAARPTWYQGVPTMLQDIVERARLEGLPPAKTSLRFVRAVSAPLPDRVLEDFELQFEVPVIEIYGMTETAGLITSNPLPPAVRKKGSVGIAAGPEISILDAVGNPAKPGESGEVVIRGENVMSGYEGDAQLDSQSFVGSWLRSGDEGYIDDDGFLFLTGRIKEIINRGGEKISPREIDDIALEHPAIFEVATFPIEHPSLGEEVAIAVVLRDDVDPQEIGERDLIDFFSSRLAYFKVPRAVYFTDALPKTAGGKLKRHAVAGTIGVGEREVERVPYVAPQSPLAQSLASMWERALGISPIGANDNFFDLGGDSLKAATFMRELVGDSDLALPVSSLFDAPTIAEFVEVLEQNGYGGGTTSSGSSEALLPSGLPVSIHRELATYLAAWQGVRSEADSLIVGRNTMGAKAPLFWCCNASNSFALLADKLGADQPVFGMRTLRHLEQNCEENVINVAAHYAIEIMQLQPQGPYLLGGFCTGGKIAFEIAQHLIAAGREVSLLFLQEIFVPKPYAGPVAMYFCSREHAGRHSPYRSYLRPELGWSKLYSGPYSVKTFDWRHREYYSEPNIDVFAAALAGDIALANLHEAPAESKAAGHGPGLPTLPDAAYRAEIEVRAPRWFAAGELMTLRVHVTNAGSIPWLPSEASGVFLRNRWRSKRASYWLDGCTPLTREIAPGESLELSLNIEAPAEPGLWKLYVDLVDEGISWFQKKGSTSFRKRVLVTPARVGRTLRRSRIGRRSEAQDV